MRLVGGMRLLRARGGCFSKVRLQAGGGGVLGAMHAVLAWRFAHISVVPLPKGARRRVLGGRVRGQVVQCTT